MKRIGISGIIVASLLIISACFVFVQPVHASSIDTDGLVNAGEVIDDDLLLTGENVEMNGTVNGALIASGSTVTITGTVNGDVIAVGQTVVVTDSAQVTGNIFSGARTIQLNGKVDGSVFAGSAEMVLGSTFASDRNVYYGGYSLTAQEGSTIAKDLRDGSYQAILNGQIGQDTVIDAGAIELNGKFGRNVQLNLGQVSTQKPSSMPEGFPQAIDPGLRVSSSAQIAGSLDYTSSKQFSIDTKPAGGVKYTQYVPTEDHNAKFGPDLVSSETGNGFKVWHMVSTIITLLLAGALMVFVFGNPFTRTVTVAENRTLASAGVGLLVLFLALPVFLIAAGLIILVGLLVSFISLGGLSTTVFGLGLGTLGLAGTVLIVLISIVSKLIFSYLVGLLVLRAFKNPQLSEFWQKALPLVIGVVIFALLSAVPYVGGLFKLAAIIIGLGAIWFWIFPGKSAQQVPPEIPAEVPSAN